VKRRGFVAALAALFVGLFIMAGPAKAATYSYQVPSDGSTHSFVNSDERYGDSDLGCHQTGIYSGQRVVFCVWLGAGNTIWDSSSYTDTLLVALKWRCYDTSNNPVVCGNFQTDLHLTFNDGIQTYFNSFPVSCDKNGSSLPGAPFIQCMGYPGSGTYTNNTGWYQVDFQRHGRGTTDLWPYVHGYTANETLNGTAVGSADTNTWDVYDVY
jgi:hypothetical protein